MIDIDSELARLAALPPGWDSYGGDPVRPEVIATARKLAASFPDDTPMPKVVPLSSGGLQFEWAGNGQFAEMEIEKDGTLGLLLWRGSVSVDDAETINGFLSRLKRKA